MSPVESWDVWDGWDGVRTQLSLRPRHGLRPRRGYGRSFPPENSRPSRGFHRSLIYARPAALRTEISFQLIPVFRSAYTMATVHRTLAMETLMRERL